MARNTNNACKIATVTILVVLSSIKCTNTMNQHYYSMPDSILSKVPVTFLKLTNQDVKIKSVFTYSENIVTLYGTSEHVSIDPRINPKDPSNLLSNSNVYTNVVDIVYPNISTGHPSTGFCCYIQDSTSVINLRCPCDTSSTI